jgi:opacity protein-like surface antigen
MRISSKLLVIIFLFLCSTVVAQEYRYEVGLAGGTSMYMGDANQSSFSQGWNPSAGILFRNNLNFRWALKLDLLWGEVTGDTKNIKNVFPDHANAAFSRNFFETGGQLEFNFLPYSDKYSYLNTSKLSPYILVGLGFTFAPGKNRTFFDINLPMGVGIKYKIRNKINIGLEYSVHHLFNDGLDAPDKDGFNLDNPYKTNNSLFKNKDWYNTLLFSVTWEFGRRDERCATD